MMNFTATGFFLLAGEFLRNPTIDTANILKKEIDGLVRFAENRWSFKDGTHTLHSRGPVLQTLAKAVPTRDSKWQLYVGEDTLGVFNTIEAAKTCAEQVVAIHAKDC